MRDSANMLAFEIFSRLSKNRQMQDCKMNKRKNKNKYCILMMGIFMIYQPIISVDILKYLSPWQWPSKKQMSNVLFGKHRLAYVVGGLLTSAALGLMLASWLKKRTMFTSDIMIQPRTLAHKSQGNILYPQQQGLVILLDDKETNGKEEDLTKTLEACLYYEVPTLTSTSLLKNCMLYMQNDKAAKINT